MSFRALDDLLVTPADPLHAAITRIDRGRCGIALVVDGSGQLLGTITDGDVRRALLAHQDMETPVADFLQTKASTAPARPVTAPLGAGRDELLRLMTSQSVRQVPLLDAQGAVADLAILDDVLPKPGPPMQAVIMAGGRGTRLMPLTEDLPKPMLPVGGRPLLERIIEQLHEAGIRHVNISTHYKSEKIVDHFGDGRAFGVDLQYVNEDRPLGTGGALGLMSTPSETQLVINGDILTQVDFRAMRDFHQDHGAEMTVAVGRYEVQVPYGVVECDGARVARLKEKPQVGFLINAGVYLLEPSVYNLIPSGHKFNMTDLIHWLLEAGRPVIGFPIREYWLDVGQHGDYAQAEGDMRDGKVAR